MLRTKGYYLVVGVCKGGATSISLSLATLLVASLATMLLAN
jgi:hypothetical protein